MSYFERVAANRSAPYITLNISMINFSPRPPKQKIIFSKFSIRKVTKFAHLMNEMNE